MPIIDAHGHPWDWTDFTPDGDGDAYWDRCLAWAERLDVAYLVSRPFAPGRRRTMDPEPDYVHAANAAVYALVQRSRGRAHGLCFVNPRHEAASLAEMEEWIGRRRFVGLKLVASMLCHLPALDPIVEWCAAHRVVVCQHTWAKANGNIPNESTPMMYAELARRHPDALLVMYHAGGDLIYGAKAARGLENLYCEIGGSDAVDGSLEQLVAHVGADHVVFGSDIPQTAPTRSISVPTETAGGAASAS